MSPDFKFLNFFSSHCLTTFFWQMSPDCKFFWFWFFSHCLTTFFWNMSPGFENWKNIIFISLPHYLLLTCVPRFWKFKQLNFYLTTSPSFSWHMSPDFESKFMFYLNALLPSLDMSFEILNLVKKCFLSRRNVILL